VPKSNVATIWSPIFECNVVRCESKNGHQKDMCVREIGVCDYNLLTILDSIINMIEGDLHDHSMNKRIFTCQ